jgi:proline iminopeptidase
LAFIICSCNHNKVTNDDHSGNSCSYLNFEEEGIKSGGVKVIKIDNNKYNVWTKRIGNNPKIKVLLLHGGPGATHEYFESFESYFPKEGIEFYYYDQLGSGNSDQPEDTSLWNIERFVEEVEQIRQALNLTNRNFYLLGHSWGGILAAEYALKYQHNLKGLIISNMMMSATQYDAYAENVLSKQMDTAVLKEIRQLEAKGDFQNPRYMELLISHYYVKHIMRIPVEEWPNGVQRAFNKLNHSVYVLMQGPSEFGISGKLETWDITTKLSSILVPTLVIGAQYDTMDPDHMKWVSTQVKNGTFLLCPKGSHMAMWDDQEHYFPGLISWLKTERG